MRVSSKPLFIGAVLLLNFNRCFAAEMNVQLTTSDGSTKMSIQNSAASEVASIDSLGNASFNRITQSGPGGSFIINQSALQSGAMLYVSSGTVVNLNTTNLKFADGTTQTTASSGSAGGSITGITAGYGISGGGTSGNVMVNLLSNSTSYIQNAAALQSGATFYVSSGTATNFNTTTLKFADGTTQTTASSAGTIQNTSTLQPGSTFYTSSGTVNAFTVGTSLVLPNTSVALAALANGTLQSGVVISSIAANTVYPMSVLSAAYPNITGVGTQGQALNMNSNLINSLANPVSATDAANKQYVDSFSKGSTNYIQVTSVPQSGVTFYVSSGTATNFNTTTLKFADGTTQTTAGGVGTITGVTAGSGLTGGGASGNVTLNLSPGGTNYIQNSSTLQSGATFYVSSGTVSGQFTSGHYAGVSPLPTIVVGAGAGAAASVSLTGTDTAGEITLNAGAAPTVSATIVTVTFNTGYTSPAYVVFSPTNNQSALLSAANGIYAMSNATTFSLVAGVTAITASVTYKWHYFVIQ